jgi:predicted TIM-barrel fold metal-dependent hydrolase
MLRRVVLEMMAGAGMGGLSGMATTSTAQAQPKSSCACGRVDVHSHFLPPVYMQALAQEGLTKADGGIPLPQWTPEAHLQMMDKLGITTALLSVSSPGLHLFETPKAIRVAREINEAGAALTQAHPGRFGHFAALPLQDVAASVDEIHYAYDHLNVDGICLETNSRGIYLGDPRFGPVFDALNERKAVVFVHPTSPECLAQIGMGYPGPVLEFPFDTARAATSLIFSGVFKNRRDIRMILSHGGGALPALVSRLAMVSLAPYVSPRPENGPAEVMEEVRRLYFDLALAATPLTFNSLLQITDMSHLLFGTDYPFAPPPVIEGNTAAFGKLMDGLPEDQRRMVEYMNATTLFPRLQAYLAATNA